MNERRRRLSIALAIYFIVVATYFAVIPRNRILEHTPFNHFSLLAESWLKGRLDLGHPPPGYAQNNDFAAYRSKWYVTFPPFPAVLLIPFVMLGKTAENVRDAQVFLWFSGVGPAVLFLALEKLRRMGASDRTTRENIVLALLLAFGTVYFFTAVQGTVWFAAHVVAVALGALYLLFSLDAERPILAGLVIGLGFLTRAPLLFAFPLFFCEAARVALSPAAAVEVVPAGLRALLRAWVARLDLRRFLRSCVLFAMPVAACVGTACVLNRVRFGKVSDFGYEYLTVAWQARMRHWGLFDYHFLARNLGVVLTSLPWHTPGSSTPFQVNEHGLALWVTTPLYLWLIWPKKTGPIVIALYATAAAVAIPGLFYQNTGWMQFGFRFSNDYAVFLVALLALTGHRMGRLFALAAIWSVAVNTFGAVTFDRGEFRRFYFEDPSQRILYQPD